jgi:transcriptional regulator with XRE-family HTH domain
VASVSELRGLCVQKKDRVFSAAFRLTASRKVDVESSIVETGAIDVAVEGINTRIAARVRQLRAEQELSLEALAARSGVSRSTLSLVERAETSPTAVVLEKIAAGLGVPLANLFASPSSTPSPISHARDRVPWKDPGTGYIRTNITPPHYPAAFQIVEVLLPPGAYVAYDGARRDGSLHQQIWVQEGTLEVTAGSVAHTLHEGDCFAMQLEGPNSFRNRTRKTVRYIVVVSSERQFRGV